jgi:hypothetical protein
MTHIDTRYQWLTLASKCCLMRIRLQPARASEAERALAYAVLQRSPVTGPLTRAQVFGQ